MSGKIKLKGNLDFDLKKIGLKSGDEVFATPVFNSKVGAMYFQSVYNGFSCNCVVWPENYDILSEESKD